MLTEGDLINAGWSEAADIVASEPISGVAKPAQWFMDALGGSATASGARVDSWTALGSVPIQACVRILAEDCAKLPIKVYKHRGDGGRDELRNHHLWRLLANKPNRWMTPFDFKAAMVSQYALNGNAVALVNRDQAGRPVELVPIEAPRVALWLNEGELWYYISFTNDLYRDEFGTSGALFPAADVVHVKWPISWNGLWGYSPILMAREAIGNSLTLDKYAGNLYANYADVGGVLTHPQKLTPETADRLRKQWERRYTGDGNRGRTAVLEEGMKFEKMAMTAQDAEFIANRKFSVEEAARLYRIPPYKLMDLTRTIQSNIEEQSYSYADDTLVPILENFEDAYEDKLLQAREPSYIDIEHDLTRFLRGREIDRYQVYQTAISNGMASPNDCLIREGKNPVPGGDVYYHNPNLTPRDLALQKTQAEIDKLEAETEKTRNPPAPPAPDPAQRELNADAAAVLKRFAGKRANGHALS